MVTTLFLVGATLCAPLVGIRFSRPARTGDDRKNVAALVSAKVDSALRLFRTGKYRPAIVAAKEALAIDPDDFDALSLIGCCHARLGEYDRAVEYHLREKQIAKLRDDKTRQAEAVNNIGLVHFWRGDFPGALTHFDECMRFVEGLPESRDRLSYLSNRAFCLLKLGSLDEARASFEEAIATTERFIEANRAVDLTLMVNLFNGMGDVHLAQAEHTDAQRYFRRALAVARECSDPVQVGISYMNLGRYFVSLDQMHKAEEYFAAARAALQRTAFKNGQALLDVYTAEMHLAQGDNVAAVEAAEMAIRNAREHENPRLEERARELKVRAYAAAGDS